MCRTTWLSSAFWHIPVLKSMAGFAQCLFWNEPGRPGNCFWYDQTLQFCPIFGADTKDTSFLFHSFDRRIWDAHLPCLCRCISIYGYSSGDPTAQQAQSGYLWYGSTIANEWPAQWMCVFSATVLFFQVSASKNLIIILVWGFILSL